MGKSLRGAEQGRGGKEADREVPDCEGQAGQSCSASGWRDQRGGGGSGHRLSLLAGYTIPRVVSPIRKCYLESFEPQPPTLEDCVIKKPETIQEKLLFGIMVDAGMVLSDKQAESYYKPHFRIQKERTHRREDHRKPKTY
jgi:hypothetical protein